MKKTTRLGGRARQFEEDGFSFDMGPSWYWMPGVFEKFFNDFGKKVSDYYRLKKLNPAYRVIFGKNSFIDIADNPNKICEAFEKIEKGSGKKLKRYLKIAEENYKLGVEDMLYKMPGKSPLELVSLKTIKKIRFFLSNIKKDVRKDFKDPRLRSVLEFPVLFLGAKASNTPSFYNFMNFADFGLGTFQSENGFHDLVKAMVKLGRSMGVKYLTNQTVNKIIVKNKKVEKLLVNEKNSSVMFLFLELIIAIQSPYLKKSIVNTNQNIGKNEPLHHHPYFFMSVLTKN